MTIKRTVPFSKAHPLRDGGSQYLRCADASLDRSLRSIGASAGTLRDHILGSPRSARLALSLAGYITDVIPCSEDHSVSLLASCLRDASSCLGGDPTYDRFAIALLSRVADLSSWHVLLERSKTNERWDLLSGPLTQRVAQSNADRLRVVHRTPAYAERLPREALRCLITVRLLSPDDLQHLQPASINALLQR